MTTETRDAMTERIIAQLAERDSDPRTLRARAELAEMLAPLVEQHGADAVYAGLMRCAKHYADQAGMSDEEFEARTVAMAAVIRLRNLAGNDA